LIQKKNCWEYSGYFSPPFFRQSVIGFGFPERLT